MYIGQLSTLTGASIQAIRLYEELGLLTDVARLGKYRTYNNDHVVLVRLITKAKSLGFKLSELKHFVEREEGASSWDCIVDMIERKEALVNSEIEELQTQKKLLSSYKGEIEACLASNPNCALDETTLDSTPKGRL